MNNPNLDRPVYLHRLGERVSLLCPICMASPAGPNHTLCDRCAFQEKDNAKWKLFFDKWLPWRTAA